MFVGVFWRTLAAAPEGEPSAADTPTPRPAETPMILICRNGDAGPDRPGGDESAEEDGGRHEERESKDDDEPLWRPIHRFSYTLAMGGLMSVVFSLVAIVVWLGPEAHGVSFRKTTPAMEGRA
jgi:hypothetical protein